MKRPRLLAALVAVAMLVLALAAIVSPPGSGWLCGQVESDDRCGQIPICSALRQWGTDGPSWACLSWAAD